ncbi:MAG: helix-hairpin-helix domain-containing protein [Proteobacteria bacterium]|nr:helix-hairpin-helix domain-containing protein [Pseudomonadota bacterium]
MKRTTLYAGITATLFCFAVGVLAAEGTTEPSNKPAATAKKNDKLDAKKQAAAKTKLVNINGASKEELMTLPNIGAAEAEKIIAGRPYGSKSWLMTRNVLPESTYVTLKALVVAKQPYEDSAKNAALYESKKK